MSLYLIALLLISILGIVFGTIRNNKVIRIASIVVFLLLISYTLFTIFVTFE